MNSGTNAGLVSIGRVTAGGWGDGGGDSVKSINAIVTDAGFGIVDVVVVLVVAVVVVDDNDDGVDGDGDCAGIRRKLVNPGK